MYFFAVVLLIDVVAVVDVPAIIIVVNVAGGVGDILVNVADEACVVDAFVINVAFGQVNRDRRCLK